MSELQSPEVKRVERNRVIGQNVLIKPIILLQKVATGTAYACLRPIERYASSGAYAHSQKVPGLRMFPYASLLQKNRDR